MKKVLTLLLCCAMLASLFSGCRQPIDNSGYEPTGDALLMEGQDPEDLLPEEENTQELTLAYYDTRSMNPLFGSDYSNRVLFSLMYQGLFATDNNYNVTPILCSRYQVTPDNRTWTFYLEPNATFSDGTRVTVNDVVASYEEAMGNDFYMGRFFYLDRVQPSSDGGIDFFLTTPYENLPLLLDIPILKASEVEAEHPLGTGPYMFSEGLSGPCLNRNPNWWCGKAELAATDLSIDLVSAESPAQVRDEFEFGDVGIVCANPQTDSYADFRCDYELWEIENGYMMYIGCNITYSDFFEDGTLRTYLTYAIDREKLVRENYNGLAYPVTLPASPQSPFYNKSLAANYVYDDMRFVNSISHFQIPEDEHGRDKELRLLVNSDDSARLRCAREIAKNLTELGLPCVTVEYGSAAFKAALQAANFDIYLGVTRLSPTMDLTEFFRPWGEMHWGGIANETLQGMCKQALENSGNYYNLHKLLAEDGRIIPVMFGYYAVYGERGLLTDLAPSRDNVFYYSLGKTMDDIQMETVYN